MLPLSPAYLFIVFLVIVAGYVGYKIVVTKQAANAALPKSDEENDFELLPFVEYLLQSLNCTFTHEVKEEWQEYNFKYQSGNFIVICKEQDKLLRIHYPNFFSTKIDDLDLVREVCNTCNAHGFSHHVLYTANGQENTLSLHITSSLSVVDNNEKYITHLRDVLSHFFNLAQEFYLRFDKGKERYKDISPHDAEENYLKYEREFYMLREMETTHQPSDTKMVASPDNPLCISTLLKNIYGWKQPELLELKVVTHQLRTIVNETDIAEFDISRVLVSTNTEGIPNFIGRQATLILTFSSDRQQQQCFPQQMVIALENEGSTSDALYQRATIAMHLTEAQNKNTEYDKDNPTPCYSFVFAFDKVDRKVIEDKVNKTLSSLKEKCDQNDFSHLTSDEILAFKYDNPDLFYYQIHAESLFRQKRYYETIVELEYIYQYLSPRFLSLNHKEQNAFYEICYHLGFSYDAIGLYKQAYYYLDAICPLNHINYMEEYVNCLVNNKDFRTLSIIENMETLIKNQVTDSDGTLPEKLQSFLNFLKRRRAHHLIDLGYYDKAKELFQAMYQEPENQDYALNELAYLQKLCEKPQPNQDHLDNNNSQDN